MTEGNVTGMTKTITEYGMGVVAVAILFMLVIVLVGLLIKTVLNTNKAVIDNNKAHREEMIPVLKALTESLDTLSETQTVLKEQLIERIGHISGKVDTSHSLLETHIRDCSRLEGTLNQLQPSILKTEERTKVCVERTRKGAHEV